MKKRNIIIALVAFSMQAKSQLIQDDLFGRNIEITDNKFLLVTGGFLKDNLPFYRATLYDKNLNIVSQYNKQVPVAVEAKKFNIYQSLYGNVLYVMIGSDIFLIGGWRLKLKTDDMTEISFFEKNKENSKAEIKDNEHRMLKPYQEAIEGNDIFTVPRYNKTNNRFIDRFIGSKIIDFDYETGNLCLFKLTESRYNPLYAPIWEKNIAAPRNMKLVSFDYADENVVIGRFIQKAGRWRDYIGKIDTKSKEIEFLKEVEFPDKIQLFDISFLYYDKENVNTIVAGEMKADKYFTHLGILIYDRAGNIINSYKISYPEYVAKQAGILKQEVKNKHLIVESIGKLPNGNYYLDCKLTLKGMPQSSKKSPLIKDDQPLSEYSLVGFSYYEINNIGEVVKSNFMIANNFNKNTLVECEGFSGNGKKVVYSITDNEMKSFFVMDMEPGVTDPIKKLESSEFNFDLHNKPEDISKDIFDCYMLDDRAILFRKTPGTEKFSFKSFYIE